MEEFNDRFNLSNNTIQKQTVVKPVQKKEVVFSTSVQNKLAKVKSTYKNVNFTEEDMYLVDFAMS